MVAISNPQYAKKCLWNLNLLSHPPKVDWINKKAAVKSLYYEGLPYNKQKTYVFAYYATPGSISGNPSMDKNLPGIVFAHGCEGRASQQIVQMWAQNGYAAISMDLEGKGPGSGPYQYSSPPKQYMSYDWNYQAVARIVLAHSLMLSFKEINPEKTYLTGVSLGGDLTCIAAAIDNRFKAAASVFGCGFMYKDGFFKNWYDTKLSGKEQDLWKNSLDPSNYLGHVSIPFLFAATTNDKFYPLDILSDSYHLLNDAHYLFVWPKLVHSEEGAKLAVLKSFFDHYAKGKPQLPEIKTPVINGGEIVVKTSNVNPQSRVFLAYTTDMGPYLNRDWKVEAAQIVGNTFLAKLPSKKITVCAFIYIDGENKDVVLASRLFFAEK